MSGADRYCLLCRSNWAHGAPTLPPLNEDGLCLRCEEGIADCVAMLDAALARRRGRPAPAAQVPGQLELGAPVCLCGHVEAHHDQDLRDGPGEALEGEDPIICRHCICELFEVEA